MLRIHYMTMVPDCPFCGSPRTGRFISGSTEHEQQTFIEHERLRRGEYVRVRQPWHANYDAFCLDCGNAWFADLRGQYYTKAEKQEYIKHKLIQDSVQVLDDAILAEEALPRKERKQLRKTRKPQGNAVAKQALSLAGKSAKNFTKLMIYDPIVGTAKDVLGLNSQIAPKQEEPAITFQDLYNEIMDEEQSQNTDLSDADFEDERDDPDTNSDE